MFDIAFSELLVIMVVGLIVIGPDKLPKLARTAGLLIGKAQRQIAELKIDIERDLRTQELQNMEVEMRKKISTVESEIHKQVQDVKAEVKLDSPSKTDALETSKVT
jgi:sec-independent protein translocase protein TatB